MLIIVTYDIADDKRRYRVSKLLEGFGQRVLESVFECDLTQSQFSRMERRLTPLMKDKADGARVYTLCGDCKAQTRIYGAGTIEKSDPFYLV